LAMACGRIRFDEVSDGALGDAVKPPLACPELSILCDDFETGTTSMWTGTSIDPGATIEVTTEFPHTGRFSLDANVPAIRNGAYATVYYGNPVPQSTGVIAMRSWIYATTLFTRFDEVSGLYNTATQYFVVGCDDLNHWSATESSDQTGIVDHLTSVPCAPQLWYCVELVYDLSARRASVFVDDAVVVDIAVVDPAPQFTRLETGASRADAAGFRVFVDDVVIANQRIGCQ
ncbi:MAG TPA: hypothetical protein VIV11_08610, partial [Kofleriaceae bacterium]